MKINLIILFLFVVIAAGCKKDPLDITPDGRITFDDVFKDEIKTEAFLSSIYNRIPLYGHRYHWFNFLAGITDEAQDARGTYALGSMPDSWFNGGLTPTTNPVNLLSYNNWWSGINLANMFLEQADKANSVIKPSVLGRLKGEAQMLRAFFYLEMIKQYGPMPAIEKPFSADFDYSTLVRPSFQSTVDLIVRDCNEVIANSNVPMRLSSSNEKGRFPRSVAYAIKSQALLFNASPLWNENNDLGKWQAAATASKEALDALTLNGNYALADHYESYFFRVQDFGGTVTDKETIHAINSIFGQEFGVVNAISAVVGGGTSVGAVPSQELVDSYDMKTTGEPAITGYLDDNHLQPIINQASGYDENNPYVDRDPRFYATVWYNGAYYGKVNDADFYIESFVGGRDQVLDYVQWLSTRTGYYLRKFYDPSLPPLSIYNASWKKFRLAEIYLNFAEAENEANGPTSEAYKAVNKIRNRVDMPDLPAGLTKDQFRERVRRERRVEFAYEEHRFWDVRRWKILDKTDKLVTGVKITKQPNNTLKYQRFVTERRASGWQSKFLLFPIPLGDVNLIPDFAQNQNPGW